MSADQNWGRWIYATMSDHFNTVITTALPGTKMYTEGADKESDDLQYLEFRMDGPHLKEISKDWWEVWISVNVLCVAKRDGQDLHKIHRIAGVAASAFSNAIEILRFGSGAGDDSTSLTCMILDTRAGEDVLINHFGQIDPDLLELQATVDGCYRGQIDTSPN